MNRIKNTILYGGLGKDTYDEYKDYILEKDVRSLTIYTSFAAAIFAALGIFSSVSSDFAQANTIIYLLTALVCVALLVSQKVTCKLRGKEASIHKVYIYTFSAVLHFVAIMLTLNHRDMPAVTYIGVLLMLPLLFAQRPLGLIISQSVFVAVFCMFVYMFKPAEIAYIDIWNGISFLFVSILTIMIIIPIRINNLIQTEIIRKMSFHDKLTGLLNRRAYEDELLDMEKNGIPNNLVIVAMDVNGLKAINDTKGHEYGDELLVGAASCMKKCFDEYGRIFRTGGDEFMAILSVTQEQEARLKQLFKEAVDSYKSEKVQKLAIASGFVNSGVDVKLSVHDMTVLADQRMYEDKKAYYAKKDK